MIAVGDCHTVAVNNKGKVFTFGWNNFGQCGVPTNSKKIFY
jgi:alpha-tubulin suppressor-like RCC1 family protein